MIEKLTVMSAFLGIASMIDGLLGILYLMKLNPALLFDASRLSYDILSLYYLRKEWQGCPARNMRTKILKRRWPTRN